MERRSFKYIIQGNIQVDKETMSLNDFLFQKVRFEQLEKKTPIQKRAQHQDTKFSIIGFSVAKS